MKTGKKLCVVPLHCYYFHEDYRGSANHVVSSHIAQDRLQCLFSSINVACTELWNEHTEQLLCTQSCEQKDISISVSHVKRESKEHKAVPCMNKTSHSNKCVESISFFLQTFGKLISCFYFVGCMVYIHNYLLAVIFIGLCGTLYWCSISLKWY